MLILATVAVGGRNHVRCDVTSLMTIAVHGCLFQLHVLCIL